MKNIGKPCALIAHARFDEGGQARACSLLYLDPVALREVWDEAEAAEIAYAGYILREPLLGYNADLHVQQFRFVANRRARQVGVEEPFPGAENVLPWLDEQANLRKEKNFFETRVTEYQTGGALAWE